jgi:uncharacterized iron-regulated membrane protein
MASRLYVHVDPYTGKILGGIQLDSGLRRKLFLLHSRLMAGEIGHTVVVITTIASIVFIVTGLILWWKFKIFGMRWNSRWRRINFDLHSVLGLYSALIFLLLAATGIIIAYDSTFYPMILRWGGEVKAGLRPRSGPDTGGRPTLDQAMAAAERALPGARITFVALPRKPQDVYSMYMRFPEEPSTTGRSRAFLDRYTTAVVATRSARETKWAAYTVDIIEAVHFGDIWGMPTRILAFLISLFVTGQVISGFLIWWKKQ